MSILGFFRNAVKLKVSMMKVAARRRYLSISPIFSPAPAIVVFFMRR